MARERWGSRLGIILAVAGSAIGLGNFLRFPVQAAKGGGGAFLIPYFVALFLLGIPLMWIEWTIGRFGGGFGHSTAPGMFDTLWRKNRFIKYFGVIGIFGPIVILIYYTYIESWLLAYGWFALSGAYEAARNEGSMAAFLSAYQGVGASPHYAFSPLAYGFFLAAFAANLLIVYFGIQGGIERVCKYALSGLTASATNEVAEVVLGGSIVIPAAFAFFGLEATRRIAQSGAFDLGFVTMPLVLEQMGLSRLFGFLWFMLLFLAGVTSSISLAQPAIAFLEDEFNFSRRRAVAVFAVATFVLCQPCIFFLGSGVVDEMDFWGGTFALVLFGTVETILFGWVFGLEDVWAELVRGRGPLGERLRHFIARHNAMEKAWTELHVGSDITIPGFYRFIIKYVTPAFLLCILGFWLVQQGLPTLLLTKLKADGSPAFPPASIPYVLGTRALLVVLFIVIAALVWKAWRRRAKETQP